MKRTIKLEDGKEIKISEESYKALQEGVRDKYALDVDDFDFEYSSSEPSIEFDGLGIVWLYDKDEIKQQIKDGDNLIVLAEINSIEVPDGWKIEFEDEQLRLVRKRL